MKYRVIERYFDTGRVTAEIHDAVGKPTHTEGDVCDEFETDFATLAEAEEYAEETQNA